MKNRLCQYIMSLLLVLTSTAAKADDVTIFSTSFTSSEWTGATIEAGSTINGIYFNSADFNISNGVLNLNANATNTKFFAIKLTGVNGRVDVSIGNGDNRARIAYKFEEGTTISSTGNGITNSNTASAASNAGQPTTFSYTMTGTGSDLILYLGRQGSSYTTITDITVTTPSESGASKTPVTLFFDNPTTTVAVGSTVTNTVTTSPEGITGVVYTSNNTSVASVGLSTGLVTGVSEGTAIITASYPGDETHYSATSVTYQIEVTSAGGGESPVSVLTVESNRLWKFSDDGWGTSVSTGIINNMSITDKNGEALEIRSLDKIAEDGEEFTKELYFGGKSTASMRLVKIRVVKDSKVTVYMRKNGDGIRSIVIAENSFGSSDATTIDGEGVSVVTMGSRIITSTANETDVYIYCANGAANLLGVKVEPTATAVKQDVQLYFDDDITTTVAVGSAVTNVAKIEPALNGVTYSSDDTAVATVDNNGVVTGVAAGTANITATYAGNDDYNSASDSYQVTVVEVGALTPVVNYIWTFNNWETETYTTNTVNDNLEIGASSEKTVQITSKTATADNIAFKKVANMGGAGSSVGRYIHVKVGDNTKVTVYGATTKNGTERTMNIATGTIDNVAGTFTSSSTSAVASGSIECTTGTDVYVYSANSGMNIFGIKVEAIINGGGGDEGDQTTTTPAQTEQTQQDEVGNTVAQDSKKNQLKVELNDGTVNYYNTDDIASVTTDKALGTVTITLKNNNVDNYYGTVAHVTFAKKVEEESGGEVTGTLTITEAKGWYESAYVKFTPVNGASYYNVYVKGGQYNSYTKIDDELVRNYGSYGRADALGLRAGTYSIKVVAVSGNTETSTYGEATGLTVRNYSRDGFAHKNYTGVGAYNDDGTLKSGARVVYITKQTAATVKCDVITGNNGATTTYTGFQNIIYGYQKGFDQTPITFRIIGTVDRADLDAIMSSEEGIQIKGKSSYSVMNMTIEGVGDDATTRGFGFLIRNSSSIEFRNFANMLCMDDAVSLDTDNSHVWIHNMDLFYGASGSAADQVKGDGTLDVKGDSQWITFDHNHFFDNGKSSLCGMKSESGPNYITYHHNWFDHSDSRHPRIRTMSVHVWNNYFDGNAKYGVGACMGSSAFVDRNYFRNCKIPMMISLQGTDAKGAKGTFSGEAGGMIKSYGNVRTGSSASNYVPHTSNSTSFDAYEATSATEQVPSSYKTLSGNNTYDNFDTNSSVMYSYTADTANEIPTIITGFFGAGRLNHGDFTWTFNNSTEDTNYSVISELKNALSSYTTSLVGWFK